jgi:uroporphyrin-III C-methyltransferase
MNSIGKVYLVGAGPGDPELLTLKAARVIGLADVLLVDDLVSDEILNFAKADARTVFVGKRGGCKSTPQAFIERLLVSEAEQGRVVVRLKGGDPYVFGRGGEERQALLDAGIPCEVINGITAGLAGPASIGIPLTHRDFCHGAILVTGHVGEEAGDGDTERCGPNWSALVATDMPLVIYMGVSRIREIAEGLMTAGMPGDMPVAVIQNATRTNERHVVTTLSNVEVDMRAAGIASPAIVFVGRAAASAVSSQATHSAGYISGQSRISAAS